MSENTHAPVGTVIETDIDIVVLNFNEFTQVGFARPRGWKKCNVFIPASAVVAAGWDSIEFGTMLVADIVMSPKGEHAVNLREKQWENEL
jgi:cold shock CspA family protein